MRCLLVLAALACNGCIAFSVRAHVGGVADDTGRGVQAGLALGFGYSTSDHSGVVGSVDIASGTAPTFGLGSTIDYIHLGDHMGMRAGLGGVTPIVGDGSLTGVHAASLFVVKDGRGSSSSEKGGSSSTRTALVADLEGAIGAVFRRDANERETARFGGSVSVGLTLLQFSRMRL